MSIFTKGNENSLSNTPIDNGKFRLATDSKSLFFDMDDSRFEITDFVSVADLVALEDILTPIAKKFYFVESENSLYKYINSSWSKVGESAGSAGNIIVTIPASAWVALTDNDYSHSATVDVEQVKSTDYPTFSLLPAAGTPTPDEFAIYSAIKELETNDGSITIYINSSTTPIAQIEIVLHL